MRPHVCLMLLLCTACPSAVLATATIDFEQIQPGVGKPDLTDFAIEITGFDWVDEGPFTAEQINRRQANTDTGELPTLFHNGSNKTFTDFHIWVISPVSLAPYSFDLGGDPFFDNVSTTINSPKNQPPKSVTFNYSGGDGIQHCTYFAISVNNFPDGTTFSLRPTKDAVVPVPGALALCVLGAAVTHSLRRKRLL